MAVKPNGRVCAIREQIIEDPVSGLTLQIAFAEDDDEAPFRLRIYGDALPFGNREFVFDEGGGHAGAGTALCGSNRATWLRKVKG